MATQPVIFDRSLSAKAANASRTFSANGGGGFITKALRGDSGYWSSLVSHGGSCLNWVAAPRNCLGVPRNTAENLGRIWMMPTFTSSAGGDERDNRVFDQKQAMNEFPLCMHAPVPLQSASVAQMIRSSVASQAALQPLPKCVAVPGPDGFFAQHFWPGQSLGSSQPSGKPVVHAAYELAQVSSAPNGGSQHALPAGHDPSGT